MKTKTDLYPKVNVLLGQKFGRLFVVSFVGIDKNRKATWKCVCDCGKEMITTGNRLLNGNTTSCGCYNKEVVSLPEGQASSNKTYGIYKRNAERRGLEFSLSKDEFEKLIHSNCFYCGCLPSRYFKIQNGNGGIFYNGIDRVDNEKGYITGNVVSCCSDCNYAKREMSYEQFVSWISRVYNYIVVKDIQNAV